VNNVDGINNIGIKKEMKEGQKKKRNTI
jgi:hypothetical protein